MIYDLRTERGYKGFVARCKQMLLKREVVELTRKEIRTKSQNNYLHLLLGVVAMDTGNTLEYCKEWYFKRLVNPDVFITQKVDRYMGKVETIRSSADLTKEEMSMAIDRFKRWGSENGFYMPNPDDESLLKDIAIEMARSQAYIGG
jgi:hypothetical protein